MNSVEAVDVILSRLNAGIPNAGNFSWIWPDEPEDPHKDLPRITVNFDVEPGDHTLGEKGSRFFQRKEVLVVMVKAPVKNSGGLVPSTVAGKIRDLFEGEQLTGGVWFRECLVHPFGRVGTDIVYGVRCKYTYQEQK